MTRPCLLLILPVIAASCGSSSHRYWLEQLETGSLAEAEIAAHHLVESSVEEAIPFLVDRVPPLLLPDDEPDSDEAEALFDRRELEFWAHLIIAESAQPPFSVEILTRYGAAAIPYLKKALLPANPDSVRIHASFTLRAIGAPAKVAIPDLQAAIAADEAPRHPGVTFGFVASMAILDLDPQADIPPTAGSPLSNELHPDTPPPPWASK